ncbi:MAG: hypothetical protein WKF57_06715 [Nakamurella sp.]
MTPASTATETRTPATTTVSPVLIPKVRTDGGRLRTGDHVELRLDRSDKPIGFTRIDLGDGVKRARIGTAGTMSPDGKLLALVVHVRI